MSTAIISALPRELQLLTDELHAHRHSNQNGVMVYLAASGAGSSAKVVLAAAGMGHARVPLAVSAALEAVSESAPVDTLISTGLAGACDPRLPAGEAFQASLVIDSRTGERFSADPSALLPGVASLVLATSTAITGVPEKHRLHDAYGAAAVDMEAAVVARLARARGLRFAALKGISDDASDDLTHLAAFAGPHGEFRTAAFALHTAFHPTRWKAAARLGRHSKSALAALTKLVLEAVRRRSGGLA